MGNFPWAEILVIELGKGNVIWSFHGHKGRQKLGKNCIN